jgi:hypothetical protein
MQVGNFNIQLKISEIPAESVMTTGGITANAFVFLVYDVTNQESFKDLEDYIEKERNLRYMLRKLSQNFILQESFTETMLRENVF